MNITEAQIELQRLKALDDGTEYCITLHPYSGSNSYSVGEKTIAQKAVDKRRLAADPETANMKITDWLDSQRLNSEFE